MMNNSSNNPKPRSVTANSLSSASFAQYNDVDTPQTPPPQAVKAKQFIKIIDFTVYYRVSVSPVVVNTYDSSTLMLLLISIN